MRTDEVLRSVDWVLYGAALLLVILGIAMVFTASYQQLGLFSSRFVVQSVAAVVAIVFSIVIARLPYHQLKQYVWGIYGLGLCGLITVFLMARVIKGAASRLDIVGFQLQPSELMKVALVITLAWVLSRSSRIERQNLLISFLLLMVPVGMIALEPDLGMALLLTALWGGLLVFLGLSWRTIAALGVVGLTGVAIAWKWFLESYQKQRILVFLNPTHDPLGRGYNVLQSIVAFGSGRLFGRGLGHGPQSQLQFLPEQHTDFILASVGEELGFIGVTVVIALYVIVLWRILRIASQTRDLYGQLICIGTFWLLLISFVVSAGMNMGILPVTGIPLPFVSYGGSNLVGTFLLLGVVQSVRVYSKWVQALPTEIDRLT